MVATDPARLHDALAMSYRYPPGFAGFDADLIVADGDGSWAGSLELVSPREVRLDLDAPADVAAFARAELASMAGHRWSGPEAAADPSPVPVHEGDDEVTGTRLRLDGDPLDSAYRLRGGHVAVVERTIGEQRFAITVQERQPTPDGRALPVAFAVAFWDVASGRLLRSDAYTDAFVDVDGLLLPALRRIVSADDGGLRGRQLTLSDHRVRSEAAS